MTDHTANTPNGHDKRSIDDLFGPRPMDDDLDTEPKKSPAKGPVERDRQHYAGGVFDTLGELDRMRVKLEQLAAALDTGPDRMTGYDMDTHAETWRGLMRHLGMLKSFMQMVDHSRPSRISDMPDDR